MTNAECGSDFPWLTQKAWAVARYGHPVFRVPVDPGWGCPNRDAAGRGGCTFCAEDGGRARQLGGEQALVEQVRRGAAFARERYGAEHLQLYVQAYTATYTSAQNLERTVDRLLNEVPFHSISFGTRPDCLSAATLRLLQRWNADREVWVELGVQSCHDQTLERIQRGHTRACSEAATRLLNDAGLHLCAHLIFGLPGETEDEMLASVDWVAGLPFHGMKFHNLHILRGSPMGEAWLASPFPVLDEVTYLQTLAQGLRRIPANLPVFRVYTDSPPELRLAPQQVMPKGVFLHRLEEYMRRQGWRQGDDFTGN
ncbi:MAG: TIGR01212 family radical SAM protein [Verrucomicrobia bacterium]|nr:TIGR01212 family radical SAM protein [Verrucomicrobiota bacterium]MCH8512591.1 TIGR01212 family radical SAM protein [Kiritimatiellia bacterium]